MNSSLKNLKDTYKRSDVLLPKIERHVLKKAQEPTTRRSDVMHPSEMAKTTWCGRHDYYRIIGEPINFKGRSPSFRLENVFDYGHSVHAKYQRWLREMGILWGQWVCKDCGFIWFGTADSAEECSLCHKKRIKYMEVPLEDKSLMISGHSDGVVCDADGDRMIEIKTVGISTLRFEAFALFNRYQTEQLTPEELWFSIKRPFGTHIRQGQIYLHLAQKRYPELSINEIVFIYEWKPTQDVKEFVVQYNPDSISKILDTARIVSESVEAGEPPARPPWAESPEEKVCKSCEYRTVCWGANGVREEGATSQPAVRVKRSTSAKRRRVLRS